MAITTDFTDTQKRALAIATVIAIAFGAYFLRGYFMLIVVACVVSYLFNPLYDWFLRRLGPGLSVTLTLLAAIFSVIVPLGLLIALAVVQISAMVRDVSAWVSATDLNSLGDRALKFVNDALDKVPFLSDVNVTPQLLQEKASSVAQRGSEYVLTFLQGAAGGLAGGLTAAVLFIYVFISLLSNRERVQMVIRKLNPLGEDATDLYLEKMGAMVRGAVFGQFVIALAQGLVGAVSIYVAGIHEGFFVFAIVLTLMSVIPLGGGVISLPLGVGMILFGNISGGIIVIAVHLLVVTNIDNVLRPILIPRAARLDSALMLLAVFAGITMFGFLGIIIGPVLMIVIVTTISVYLAVFKGVPIDDPDDEEDEPKAPGPVARLIATARERLWARRDEERRKAQNAATPRTAEQ